MATQFDVNLEQQIQDARNRAEAFSRSLQDARQQEAQALKILEEERSRWAQSFEEKSTMIEQLERELTFTVDALNHQKFNGSYSVTNPSLRITDNGLDSGSGEGYDDFSVPKKKNISKRDDPEAPINSPASNGATDVDSDIVKLKALLYQARKDLRYAHDELDSCKVEEEKRLIEIRTLATQLRELDEERRQLQISLRDIEGKLEFRTTQVLENERNRDAARRHENELREQIEIHEMRIKSLIGDLDVANYNLRISGSKVADLEQRIIEIAAPARTQDEMAQKLLAAETFAKLMESKLESAHQVFQGQLTAADEFTQHLQNRVLEVERRCDDFRTRADAAELDARQLLSERDYLRLELQRLQRHHGLSRTGTTPAVAHLESQSTFERNPKLEHAESRGRSDHESESKAPGDSNTLLHQSVNGTGLRPGVGPRFSGEDVEAAGTAHRLELSNKIRAAEAGSYAAASLSGARAVDAGMGRGGSRGGEVTAADNAALPPRSGDKTGRQQYIRGPNNESDIASAVSGGMRLGAGADAVEDCRDDEETKRYSSATSSVLDIEQHDDQIEVGSSSSRRGRHSDIDDESVGEDEVDEGGEMQIAHSQRRRATPQQDSALKHVVGDGDSIGSRGGNKSRKIHMKIKDDSSSNKTSQKRSSSAGKAVKQKTEVLLIDKSSAMRRSAPSAAQLQKSTNSNTGSREHGEARSPALSLTQRPSINSVKKGTMTRARASPSPTPRRPTALATGVPSAIAAKNKPGSSGASKKEVNSVGKAGHKEGNKDSHTQRSHSIAGGTIIGATVVTKVGRSVSDATAAPPVNRSRELSPAPVTRQQLIAFQKDAIMTARSRETSPIGGLSTEECDGINKPPKTAPAANSATNTVRGGALKSIKVVVPTSKNTLRTTDDSQNVSVLENTFAEVDTSIRGRSLSTNRTKLVANISRLNRESAVSTHTDEVHARSRPDSASRQREEGNAEPSLNTSTDLVSLGSAENNKNEFHDRAGIIRLRKDAERKQGRSNRPASTSKTSALRSEQLDRAGSNLAVPVNEKLKSKITGSANTVSNMKAQGVVPSLSNDGKRRPNSAPTRRCR